jgi:nondiscriminating glutamyl-tRNA synthetase
MEVLADAVPLFKALDDSKYEIKGEAQEALTWPSTKSVLLSWKKQLVQFGADFLSEEDFLKAQDLVKDECQVKGKHLFMPIRVAVIGQPQGTELKILVPLLQKSSLISRADQVLEKLGG